MQVTKINPQKFRKNLFNIYLDSKYAFALNADELFKSHLKLGSEISTVDAQKFIKIKKDLDLTDSLYRFISFRPRSEKEVRDHFKKKKIGDSEIEKIIEKAKSLNLINDSDFANWWLEQRQTFRPKGPRVLKLELKQKGISDEIINDLLNKTPNTQNTQNALKIAQKKHALLKHYDPKIQKQKLLGFLLRRGFDFDTAKDTITKLTT